MRLSSDLRLSLISGSLTAIAWLLLVDAVKDFDILVALATYLGFVPLGLFYDAYQTAKRERDDMIRNQKN